MGFDFKLAAKIAPLAVLTPSLAIAAYHYAKKDDNVEQEKAKNSENNKRVSDPKVEAEAADTAKKILDTAINAFDNVKKMVIDPFENSKNAQHTVKAGENLSMIAKKYRTSVAAIQAANGIDDPNKIKEGQVLKIPAKADTPSKTEKAADATYTVKSGDSLSKIAQKNGCTVAELQTANGIDDPNKIKKGQVLTIPGKVVANNKTEEIATDKNPKMNEVVGSGKIDRSLIAEPQKVNGKIVPTQKTFNPTAEGPLSGKTIVVNAGHGWKANGKFDPGAQSKNGSPDEAYLNFDNAMRLKDELCNQGAKVLFIQGESKLVRQALNNDSKLKNADLFISIHANAVAGKTDDRTQFYVRQKEGSTGAGKESKELANIMEKKFDKWIPANEDISNDEAFVDKKTGEQDYAQVASNDGRTGVMKPALNNDTPAVLWEVAYVTEDKGTERLNDAKLMEDYAQVATESIVEYLA